MWIFTLFILKVKTSKFQLELFSQVLMTPFKNPLISPGRDVTPKKVQTQNFPNFQKWKLEDFPHL